MLFLAIITELVQLWVPERAFNVFDLLSNVAGVVAGVGVIRMAQKPNGTTVQRLSKRSGDKEWSDVVPQSGKGNGKEHRAQGTGQRAGRGEGEMRRWGVDKATQFRIAVKGNGIEQRRALVLQSGYSKFICEKCRNEKYRKT